MGVMAFPFSAVLDVTASTLLGNNTGSAAAAQALTASQVRTLCSLYSTSEVDTLLSGKASSSHTHGNITNAGAIGSTSGVPIITGTSGVLQAGSFGSTSGTFCQGNDSRLSDSRAPTAHKTTHATGGSDALTASDIGAAATSHTHAASDITSGTIATARLASGTASASTYLRGDQTWATVAAGVGGSTGATDNAVLRADGTGGSTVQTSGVTISDTGETYIPQGGLITVDTPGAYETGIRFRVVLGGIYTGQNFAVFSVKGDGTCTAGVGAYGGFNGLLTTTAITLDGGWGSINRAGGGVFDGLTSNLFANTYGMQIRCGVGHGVHIANGTNSQTLSVYNTYTSNTSFERVRFSWSANVCTLTTEKGSAGGTLRGLKIGDAATALLGFYGVTPIVQPATSVAASTRVGGGGTALTDTDTYDGYTLAQVVKALRNLGFLA